MLSYPFLLVLSFIWHPQLPVPIWDLSTPAARAAWFVPLSHGAQLSEIEHIPRIAIRLQSGKVVRFSGIDQIGVESRDGALHGITINFPLMTFAQAKACGSDIAVQAGLSKDEVIAWTGRGVDGPFARNEDLDFENYYLHIGGGFDQECVCQFEMSWPPY